MRFTHPLLSWPGGCGIVARMKRFNFTSIRAYRRFVDAVARECYAGRRPMEDATRAAAIAKVGAELLMVEQTLAANGISDVEPGAPPLGDNGGLDLPEPGLFVATRQVEKTGISAKGTPVEETRVERSGTDAPQPLGCRPEDF